MIGKQIVFVARGAAAVRPYEVPDLAPDQILIETIYTTISQGTERAHLSAEPNTATARAGCPFKPGHQSVGREIDVGSSVTGYRIGQMVATMSAHQSHVVMPATVGPAELPERYLDQHRDRITGQAANMHFI